MPLTIADRDGRDAVVLGKHVVEVVEVLIKPLEVVGCAVGGAAAPEVDQHHSSRQALRATSGQACSRAKAGGQWGL